MEAATPDDETVPRGFLDRLRADPLRTPEVIALEAARLHGPAAATWRTAERAQQRTSAASAARARSRYARLARLEGATFGVGGWTTLVPDLVALAWLQSRLVFHLAAAFDHDPLHPMRPAELLVLQDVYDDPEEARAALDGVGTPIASAYVGGKISRARDSDDHRSLGRVLLSLVGAHAGKKTAARLVPGFASITGAIANERATRALADRAIRFYGD